MDRLWRYGGIPPGKAPVAASTSAPGILGEPGGFRCFGLPETELRGFDGSVFASHSRSALSGSIFPSGPVVILPAFTALLTASGDTPLCLAQARYDMAG